MKRPTNAIPGKQGFQRTGKASPAPLLPTEPYAAIKPVETALTPKEMYDLFCQTTPIYDIHQDPSAEVCASCAQKRRALGQTPIPSQMDLYEIQDAYITGWPCTDCEEWAVAPIGCLYKEQTGDPCILDPGDSFEVMEVKPNGQYSWRLGCVNHQHQVARLVEEAEYPEGSARTLVEMTWLAWKSRETR